MRDKAAGMTERDLRLALAEGWRIGAAAMRYAEVGGGSYHWVVRDDRAQHWFVTVDDLDDKPWLGDTRAAAAAGLRAAMDTAVALRRDAGLPFVAAPVPGAGGQTVRPVDARYAVAVITHGEPHPGNVLRAGPDRILVDWDTVALGPPERDLWLVTGETGRETLRYARLTGRGVDPGLLAFYRLRWALDDLSAFVHRLRGAHRRTADAEHAWLSLKQTAAQLSRDEK